MFFEQANEFFLKNVSKVCNLIITSSNFSKQEIVSFLNIKPKKISVIYLGTQEDLLGRSWQGVSDTEKYIFAL